MKVAYCQISAHPSFIGANGAYCKEPFIDVHGSLLGKLADNNIYDIGKKIENKYYEIMNNKLTQILASLSGLGIECLVFPEYTVPATALKILHGFSKNENCICIAASHSIQGIYETVYKDIGMDIDLESHLNMSCCPVIMPSGKTIPIFKKYKSKWESNMNVEGEVYHNEDSIIYIESNGIKIAVLICIDALKNTINSGKVNLIIVPAATPSSGQFVNKFESYLSQDIPTIFCNFFQYGGSSIFCHAPIENNIPFANTLRLIEMGKNEEAVSIVNIEVNTHYLKIKSVETKTLVSVERILPIYYRDNTNDLMLLDRFISVLNKKDRAELLELSYVLNKDGQGLINSRNKYIYDGIHNQSMNFNTLQNWLKCIYVNDFSLVLYEANWIDKTSQLVQEYLIKGIISYTDDVSEVLKRLFEYNTALRKNIFEMIEIPVFDETVKDDFSFQNRGGELRKFRILFRETDTTIYILNSFSGLGKSALVERLKYLHSFNTIEKRIPASSGFEGLVRLFADATKQALSWDALDDGTIKSLALQYARSLSRLHKTVLHIKSVGSIFDDYNKYKTISFLKYLSEYLSKFDSHIKVIVETSRNLPSELFENNLISICKLKPLLPLFIERLIEQTSAKISYTLLMPEIPFDVISACNGNPFVAKMIGVYFGNKINESGKVSLSLHEISSYTSKYVDGILEKLEVVNEQIQCLRELCIFRVPVKKYAYNQLPNYKEKVFDILRDKLIIDEDDTGFFVNPLIRSRLVPRLEEAKEFHKIASFYYENEYSLYQLSLDKAEYFYHISFLDVKLQTKEIKYFSDDILSAAISLCNNKNFEIALSHLETIKPFKKGFWKYNLYTALCKIAADDYIGYQESFDLATKQNTRSEIVYYLMIKKLISIRKLQEAENLLNFAEDEFESNKQLSALWVSLLYASNTTKEDAVRKAIVLSQDKVYDLYASKILVPLLLRENLKKEALDEIQNVLRVWGSNEWANSMKYQINNNVVSVEILEDSDVDNE